MQFQLINQQHISDRFLKRTSNGLLLIFSFTIFISLYRLFILEQPGVFHIYITMGVSLTCYGYIRRFGKVFLPLLVLCITGLGIVTYVFYYNGFAYRLIEMIWIINLTILAFYGLGKLLGFIYLFLVALIIMSISVASIYTYPLNEEGFITQNGFLVEYIIHFIFSFVCTAFLLYAILNTRNTNFNTLNDQNLKITKQEKDKEVLLKEVHHRVGNNLQIISSLLKLQSYKIKDDRLIKPFEQAVNRVSSIALIYSKIYKIENVGEIDLTTFIDKLVASLINAGDSEFTVKHSVVSNVKSLNIDSLVPFSLLIQELTYNAIQHAFDNTLNPEITIEAKKVEGNINLTFKDNGVWKENSDQDTFGLDLVEILADQLDGKMTRNIDNGTQYEFQFVINLKL